MRSGIINKIKNINLFLFYKLYVIYINDLRYNIKFDVLNEKFVDYILLVL